MKKCKRITIKKQSRIDSFIIRITLNTFIYGNKISIAKKDLSLEFQVVEWYYMIVWVKYDPHSNSKTLKRRIFFLLNLF